MGTESGLAQGPLLAGLCLLDVVGWPKAEWKLAFEGKACDGAEAVLGAITLAISSGVSCMPEASESSASSA